MPNSGAIELDPAVAAFRTRPLQGEHRHLWVDAAYHEVRFDVSPSEDRLLDDVAPQLSQSAVCKRRSNVVGIFPTQRPSSAFSGCLLPLCDLRDRLSPTSGLLDGGPRWDRTSDHLIKNFQTRQIRCNLLKPPDALSAQCYGPESRSRRFSESRQIFVRLLPFVLPFRTT